MFCDGVGQSSCIYYGSVDVQKMNTFALHCGRVFLESLARVFSNILNITWPPSLLADIFGFRSFALQIPRLLVSMPCRRRRQTPMKHDIMIFNEWLQVSSNSRMSAAAVPTRSREGGGGGGHSRTARKAIKFYLNWMFSKKVLPKDVVALVAEYAKVEFEQVK